MIRNLKIKVLPITKPSDVAKAIQEGKDIKGDIGAYTLKIEFASDPETIQKMVEYVKSLGEIKAAPEK